MKAVKLSRHGVLNRVTFSSVLLLCGLTVIRPLAATTLFDPKRGALEQADLATDVQAGVMDRQVGNSGSSMHELRLDGVLTLGDQRRVMISGPEGETYRFNWQGVIEKPMAFEGETADRLEGYRLSSVDARSVWLQLPVGTSCESNPEKGVVACEEGRAKLALVRRSAPPASPPPAAESTRRKGVQQSAGGRGFRKGMDSALARRLQQRKRPPQTEPPTRIGGEQPKKRDQESELKQLQEAMRRAAEEKPPGL